MTNEADLPTEQAGARPPPRLPGAHGDPGRSQGDRQPPRQGPRQAQRLTLIHLRQRRDFVAANAGKRAATPGFILLLRRRDDGDDAARVGFTVTRKIGNAVIRNRLKRRLRALVREVFPDHGHAGADHVLIGRGEGLTRDFAALAADLQGALRRVAPR